MKSRKYRGERVHAGSLNDELMRFAVGETRWVARDGVHPPLPAISRRPLAIRDWVFTAAAFLAVPQTCLASETVQLWRITRTA